MRRPFASAAAAFFLAAGAAFLPILSDAHADQLLDPGWELAYPGGPANAGGGFISYMFGQGREPYAVARPYQPAPRYYRPTPAPQSRALSPAPQYYVVVPAQQLRAYQQSAPQYYAPAPAQELRSQQQAAPQYYAAASAQQSGAGRQGVPQYYALAPAPQPRSYQPPAPPTYVPVPAQQTSGYAPSPVYYQVAAPQPGAYQPVPQYYQQPPAPAPQSVARNDPAAPPPYPPALEGEGRVGAAMGDMAHPAIDPKYERVVVDYQGDEQPGTIVIDTPHFFLYLVLEGGKALRYGIGVGRPGFTWAGVKHISAMREWPDWYPPSDMLERRPDLPRFLPGGPSNPLGARALYLGSTLYRIHGSSEPWTIGTQVSSGCIRLRNEDVTDLYGRVKVGTKVVVI